ncbi:MAG TPA: VCBS repeat-containing protein [Bryobacteraceae bacterium]
MVRYAYSVVRVLVYLLMIGFFAPLPMHFENSILANDLAGGYQVVACDVNADGIQDLIALASNMPDLLWFESPTWKRHVLARNLPRMINAACWSRDAHAPPVIAVASEFSMHPQESAGVVSILTPDGDPRNPWKATEIDRLPTSHRLRWADIDGSGNKVLINAPLAAADARAPDYHGHVPLVYYHPDDWKRQSIGDAEEGIVHGIFVTDWDGNGREAILIGSFLGIHLYRFGSDGKWSRTEIAKGSPKPWPLSGTSVITVGHLGHERFLAAIEPWHGNEVVVYRSAGSSWTREVVDDTLLDAHTIETVDLNGDGQDEIVAGFRGKPYGVYIYRWNGTKWERQILEQGEVSAAGCVVAELHGKRAPDIACIGSATHNLILYRNSRTGTDR